MAKAQVKKAVVKLPAKYTGSSIVGYLADKSGCSRKDVKQLAEDLFEAIAAGVMSGQRVPLGKIGKMYIRVRPAQKSRKGRNPLTGDEITIPAKPATKVPKFNFNKAFKQEALKAKVKAK